jgi:hypothetical protein
MFQTIGKSWHFGTIKVDSLLIRERGGGGGGIKNERSYKYIVELASISQYDKIIVTVGVFFFKVIF